MMCEICGIREANIKFTQVVNKNKKELHICKVCAEDKGFSNPLSGFPKIIGGLILGIMGELPETGKREHIDLKCNYCQLSWHEFQEGGLLGCGHCYESFSAPLKKILRKMHGSNKHIGNRPASQRETGTIDEVERLRKELNRAIKAENFERAAQIRDTIRDIEANLEKDF
jgi:protein arginine kinase activator